MRTREEQAKSLRDSLCADYVSAPVHEAGYELAMCHIEEAERRAEQRVRAEIGRDSERLDNMREKLRIAKNGLLRVKEITGQASRAHKAADRALIQIAGRPIDAAREVG